MRLTTRPPQCWIFSTSQLMQVAAPPDSGLCHGAFWLQQRGYLKKEQFTEQSGSHSGRSIAHQTILILGPIPVFFLLAVLLMRMPKYLALNATWICFLYSLLIAIVLCLVLSAEQPAQGLAASVSGSLNLSRQQRTKHDCIRWLHSGRMLGEGELAVKTKNIQYSETDVMNGCWCVGPVLWAGVKSLTHLTHHLEKLITFVLSVIILTDFRDP